MRLHSLRLRNFRNYTEAALDFDPRLNLFIGDNGQGKSNLLEALYFAVTGRSFRTSRLKDLIQHGADHLFLEATFSKGGISHTLSIGLDREQRRVIIDGNPQPSLNALLGLLKGVILSPEDRALVSGAPASRRRFLDLHLAQIDPQYVDQMARYTRALRQRNALLRSEELAGIEIWEQQMATHAAYLTDKRTEATGELSKACPPLLHSLSGGQEQLELRYRPRGEGDLLATLADHREKDLILGYTGYGPHRDDLQLLLNGKEARLFGSEGQKASCGLALRLAEWQRLARHANGKPLLFLDDVANALDERRKGALQELLSEVGQTFLASPHPIPLTEAATTLIRGGTCLREPALAH